MDWIYNVVEATSPLLVLHRSMTIHPIIKSHKIFKYSVHLIKDKKEVLSTQFIKNISLDEVNNTWEKCNIEFLKEYMKWVTSDVFKRVLDGV